MYWKAIYADGTELREGDKLNKQRPRLHDGKPTGELEPIVASSTTIPRAGLKQFIVYDDKNRPVVVESFPDKNAQIVFRWRYDNRANVGSSELRYAVVGKHWKDGRLELRHVWPNGEVQTHTGEGLDWHPVLHDVEKNFN